MSGLWRTTPFVKFFWQIGVVATGIFKIHDVDLRETKVAFYLFEQTFPLAGQRSSVFPPWRIRYRFIGNIHQNSQHPVIGAGCKHFLYEFADFPFG